jgi:hypothetical protein
MTSLTGDARHATGCIRIILLSSMIMVMLMMIPPSCSFTVPSISATHTRMHFGSHGTSKGHRPSNDHPTRSIWQSPPPPWRLSAATTTTSTTNDGKTPDSASSSALQLPIVEGLLSESDFARYDGVHRIVHDLPQLLTSFLRQPLTLAQATPLFDTNTRVVIPTTATSSNSNADTVPLELVSSVDEMVHLASALYWVVETSNRASGFIRAWLPTVDDGTTDTEEQGPTVQAMRLTLDANATWMRVDWQVTLPAVVQRALDITNLQGTSKLELSNGKIVTQSLERVRWNQEVQDSTVIWQGLASLRQTVRGWQQTPVFQTLVGQNPLVQQWVQSNLGTATTTTTASSTTSSAPAPPLYIQTSSSNSTNSTSTAIPAEAYIKRHSSSSTASWALPGSTEWPRYAQKHKTVRAFVEHAIPALTGTPSAINGEAPLAVIQYLDPEARLMTMDGQVRMEGNQRLARLYQTLAVMRQRTLGTLRVERIQVMNDANTTDDTVQVSIQYSITNPLGLVLVSGTDIYTLKMSPDLDPIPRIMQIKQDKLVVNGNNNTNEGIWLMRSLIAMADAGRVGNEDVGVWGTDLWQRFVRPNAVTDKTRPIVVSNEAAATAFRIMTRLHQDWRLALGGNTNSSNANALTLPTTPVAEYLADNVQLVGYLGESLVRGRAAYTQSFSLSLAPLQAALRQGQVRSTKPPKVRVELTERGSIRLDLMLYLTIRPLAGIDRLPGWDRLSPSQQEIPLTLELISEYDLDNVMGKITQHALLESRVNGQLTPADVVSRWIRRQQQQPFQRDSVLEDRSWMQVLSDALRWLDSIAQ